MYLLLPLGTILIADGKEKRNQKRKMDDDNDMDINPSRSEGSIMGTELYSPTMVKLPPSLPSATTDSSSYHYQPATPSGEASQEATVTTSPTPAVLGNSPNNNRLPDLQTSSPRLSSPWDPDTLSNQCSACRSPFDPIFKRRHHCRLCGRLFCHDCSNTRCLIPPSALVLKSDGSSSVSIGGVANYPSFAANSREDASMTFVGSTSNNGLINNYDDTILYGRGLEQRMLLARHPQRTCHSCRSRLEPLQEELCLRNSNAMRYNYIDEGNHLRAHCNSPLAFTLGHEVRKAAYTLSNLLPGNQTRMTRGSGFIPTNTDYEYRSYPPADADPCHIPSGASCKNIDPTLRALDGLRIPVKLLRRAKGIAVVTSAKAGVGFAGFEFGTGLVVARRSNPDGVEELDAWTAPSAISIASIAMGALIGAQVSDHVFLLMTDDAVRLFASDNGRSIQLGADVGVAIGPLGRSAEADLGATGSSRSLEGYGGGVAMAPIYTYSLSKGLYAGVSMDGRILMTRDRVNEKFYGRMVSAHEILSGKVATPPAAQPLYDALKRCRVYGETGNNHSSYASGRISSSIMESLSHTTGAGMPVSSHPSPGNGNMNPYNLYGRDEGFGY